MTEQNKKIQVLTSETDGFTAVINHGPANSKPRHVCLAANCGTLLAPEDFFCEYHFQKLPAELCWAYVKATDGPPRQMILQQMADHLSRPTSGDEAAELALGVCQALVTWAQMDHDHEGGCFEHLVERIVPLAAQAVRLAEGR